MSVAPRLAPAAHVHGALERLPAVLALPRLRVSFIVPVFNEATTVGEVLRRVAELPFDVQIVVVDDGSTDGSSAVIEETMKEVDGRLLRQPNRGKGAAIRAAIPYVDGEIVVIQDRKSVV